MHDSPQPTTRGDAERIDPVKPACPHEHAVPVLSTRLWHAVPRLKQIALYATLLGSTTFIPPHVASMGRGGC